MTSFPDSLSLTPVSRRPLRLAPDTLRTVLERPFPSALQDRQTSQSPVASIIVVTWNNLAISRLCIESLLAQTDEPSFELIVVDNGSTDGTPDYLRELARAIPGVVAVVNPDNRGFAAANNQGLARARGGVLVLLNNDTVVPRGWLSGLMRHLRDPAVGIVGPVTNRIGNEAEIETGYGTYREMLHFAAEQARRNAGKAFDIPTLCMFCVAMRRDVLERLGPLDEQFATGLLEDDDFSMRAHAAGYRVVCAEDVFVHHFGQASFGELFASGEYGAILEQNRRRYQDKWGAPWKPYNGRAKAGYTDLIGQVAQAVRDHVPEGSVVLVVSRGDEELLKFPGRTGWHFPQTPDGLYAGHHPADSRQAIEHLNELRERGARYLLLPQTAFWWLEHYTEFAAHLAHEADAIYADPAWRIYRFGAIVGSEPSQPLAPPPAAHLRFALAYSQTLPLAPPSRTFDPSAMNLHWLIPNFRLGAGGGPKAIELLIGFLNQRGHRNTVWGDDVDPGQIDGDAVIATHYRTAYPAHAVTAVRQRFYLVQDFEPAFYPMGAEYLLAEATYRFGFHCITSSRWLQEMLRDQFGAKVDRFVYAYDPTHYHPDAGEPRSTHRIAFYARSSTPRRAVELGLLALEIVAREYPTVHVDFFGANVGRMNVPYAYTDHGVLTDAELARLYRHAALGMVFSATNYSLIPHEMMACGLPVVDLRVPSTIKEFAADAITLAKPTPRGIATEVLRLLRDPSARVAQAARAAEHVKHLSWETTSREVEQALVNGIGGH